MGRSVSPDSHASLAAIDRTVRASSEDAGWTSLLVEYHEVRPDEQVVEIPPTPDQAIVVGVRGAQRLEVVQRGRSDRAVYGAGTIGLTRGGQGQRLRRHRALGFATFEKINIYVPAETVSEIGEFLARPGSALNASLQASAVREQAVASTAGALVAAMRRGAPDLYAEAAAQWLVTHLLSADPRQRPASMHGRHYPTATRARLDGVLELMRTSYAEPLSLDRLAAEARVSKYHLSRLFREATGSTPHAYLVRVRLEAAARLLEGTDLPVAQVAHRCGFVRPAHFGAAFSRRHGVTPSAYRRRDAS